MLTKETKHYVEFEVFTGRFFDDNSIKEVEGYSVDGVEIPEQAIAYCFFKRDVMRTESDGEQFEKWSDDYDKTGWHYIDGVVQTLDDIADTPDNQILRFNLEANSSYYQAVVRTRFGSYRPFKLDDKIA